MMTWLKQKNDKLNKLLKQKPIVLDKIQTLRKMRKDFPASDDVRFSLQDAITDLNKIDKQLMMLQ
jgi:uncharacterized membrane protein YcaP (DUF421 family)|tara:strand:+ start:138 stop:332 length:195 start_codon:yes stop_codon:yes gene_type:complete